METPFKRDIVKELCDAAHRHGIKIDGRNFARLVVECRDKAVAMTVGRKNANYVDVTDADAISGILGNYSGLTSRVDATSVQHGELVQYYCTDWDFLLSRAEVNGLLVLVDDGEVTVQAPDGSASASLTVTYGQDLIEFDADLDARTQLEEVKAASWDPSTQELVDQAAQATPLTGQGNLQSSDLSPVIGLGSYRLQSNAAMASDFLKSWADGCQLKAALARIQGRMRFQGSPKATIGGVIELAGVGDRFNGNVFVSSVRHDIARGNWITEVEFGLPPDWFADRRDLVAPPASGLVPGVEGLQIGVVKKLDQDPDASYRIQVSVPLLAAETEGVWARLAQFYASDGIGAFFVPEIGDEVVLGYLNNDPAHPVILGSLYSGKHKPPYEPEEQNNTKAVVTRSELKIEFDEEKKAITIITPAENQVVLSDDGKSILLQDQTGNKVELTESGIQMSSPKDIEINASGKIDIQATGEIGITSSADVNVSGLNVSNKANAAFSAQGSASAELSASGNTTVKGAMVMIN
jgi:Rhs element Vgr protein